MIMVDSALTAIELAVNPGYRQEVPQWPEPLGPPDLPFHRPDIVTDQRVSVAVQHAH
jgi:hypothetical protein